MLSSILLVILPLFLSSTHSLPNNIFDKREALGGPITRVEPAGAYRRSPQGHFGGGHCTDGWQACMSSLCAGGGGPGSATGGMPPATGIVSDAGPEDTGAPAAGACTAMDGSCDTATTAIDTGEKRRRQEVTGAVGPQETGAGPQETGAGPQETGAGPQETGAGPQVTGAGPQETGGSPGQGQWHGLGRFSEHKNLANFCSGFQDFMQQSGGAVTGGAMPQATPPPTGPEETGVPVAESSVVATGVEPLET